MNLLIRTMLLVGTTGCAVGTAAQVQPTTPAAPGFGAAEIVQARQVAFHLSAGTFGGMKAVIDSGGEVRPLAFGARGLARWARTLPAMFPEGAVTGNSRALPEIWSNRADFEAKAADYADAATRLAELAQAGDRTAFAAQFDVTRATCSACHDSYRRSSPAG